VEPAVGRLDRVARPLQLLSALVEYKERGSVMDGVEQGSEAAALFWCARLEDLSNVEERAVGVDARRRRLNHPSPTTSSADRNPTTPTSPG